MDIYEVTVSKRYDKSGRLYGQLAVQAVSAQAAKYIADEAMQYRNGDCLQTIDPRIVWDGEGEGDYIDFSFRVEDDEPCPGDENDITMVLLSSDDIRVSSRTGT